MTELFILLAVSAVLGYLLGCVNGAILISKTIFHEDVREKGSGNAGLTNFYRVYGVKGVLFVIAIDVLKMVVAVLAARYAFAHFGNKSPVLGMYWTGLFAILGHCFPCMFRFHGGKGILSAGTLLILLDWRIALVGFSLFFAGAITSGYISLGSILAIVSFPLTTWWVYHGHPDFLFIILLALVASTVTFWSHRSNVKRLISGKENKFHVHNKEEHP